MITLATLKDATEQDVFDQAVNHLLTQNSSSMYEGANVCAYMNGGGLKCAAGCFISDDEYNIGFERYTWLQLVTMGVVDNSHSELIWKLQYIHDRRNVKDWKDSLINLAEQRGLTFNWK